MPASRTIALANTPYFIALLNEIRKAREAVEIAMSVGVEACR